MSVGLAYPRLEKIHMRDDYTVLLRYVNGEQRLYDMKPLLDEYPFTLLNGSLSAFKQAKIEGSAIAWSDDIDIAPEELYRNSVSLKA